MAYSTIYEIPTIPAPQTFEVTLAGVLYNFRLLYRGFTLGTSNSGGALLAIDGSPLLAVDGTPMLYGDDTIVSPAGWVLDIADAGGNPLVNGIPLVTGCDLLAPYAHLQMGGALVVGSDVVPDQVPGFADLGITSHLLWLPST